MFYDWLYLGAIYPHRVYLLRLKRYAAFSDIEFNPERSINCQARSCALFVSLTLRELLDGAMSSSSAFRELLLSHDYGRGASSDPRETHFTNPWDLDDRQKS
jgi:hypothetical protein